MGRVLGTAVVLFFCYPVFVSAQIQVGDWEVVRALSPGSRLMISLPEGVVKGRVFSVNETHIILDGRIVPRSEVQHVEWLQTQRGKGFRRGFLIGFAFGAASAYWGLPDDNAKWAIFHGGRIGALGGLIGLAWGTSKDERVLIYRK
jgi:hypothetical protein